MDWGEFLSFRKFVTPAVIQIVFWLLILANLVWSIIIMTGGGWNILIGFIAIFLGSLTELPQMIGTRSARKVSASRQKACRSRRGSCYYSEPERRIR